jgi:hypothetical protein
MNLESNGSGLSLGLPMTGRVGGAVFTGSVRITAPEESALDKLPWVIKKTRAALTD